jgi:hypothetical protein
MPVVNEDHIRRAFDGAKAEFGIFSDQLARYLRQGGGDTSAIHLAGSAVQEHIDRLLGTVPVGDGEDTDITEEDPTITHVHKIPYIAGQVPRAHTPVPEVPNTGVKPNPVAGAGVTTPPGVVVTPAQPPASPDKVANSDKSTQVSAPPAGAGAVDSKSKPA